MRTLLLGLLLSSGTALAQPAPPAAASPSPTEARPAAPAPAPAPQPPATTSPAASTAGEGSGNAASDAATAPATASAPAPADAKPPSAPVAPMTIVIEDLPQSCRDLGKLAQSQSRAQSLSARISLANCIVEQKLRGVPLCDCEQSVREAESASELSFKLLDEVFLFGDPAAKILARQALGDLLASLATRMLATIPPLINGNEASLALRDTRHALLRPLIDPWFVRAQAAYTELERIARQNPQLAKNSAVVAAVRSSRTKLQQVQGGVAKR